jgi:cytoskeletal protein CcmA (bactofilin family)
MARQTLIALLVAGMLAACGVGSINGPVSVPAGQKTGDVSAVNGSIDVGDDASITNAATVNGGITIGARVHASALATVNGGVALGDSARVDGNVATVNGALTLAQGAEVRGKLTNVNGEIRLTAAHVGGDIGTYAGDILIGANSHVDGGIRVEQSNFSSGDASKRVPRVVIGPGAVVRGPLRFEREVKLYVSDSATIGPVEGASAVKFSGDQPPA